MKSILKSLFIGGCLILPIAGMSQNSESKTQDPRGVYKLTTITSNGIVQYAPFDQYKICTDSVSLTVAVNDNGLFRISNADKVILNYTGEEVKGENDTSTKIYDSDDKGFTLKWWSEIKNHILFPYRDWCIEKYQVGEYSSTSSKIFSALMTVQERDKKNDLIGTWRVLGRMDELRDVKEQLKSMYEKNPTAKPNNNFVIFLPDCLVDVSGVCLNVSYEGKKSIKTGGVTQRIKWLKKDLIAIEFKKGYQIDYTVYERVTGDVPIISYIADRFVK